MTAPRGTCSALPKAALLLRKGDGWQPVYQALGLDWLDRAAGTDEMFSPRPGLVVDMLVERLASLAAAPTTLSTRTTHLESPWPPALRRNPPR